MRGEPMTPDGVRRRAGALAAGVRSGIRRRVRSARGLDLSRTEPVSRLFGFDRGLPIDRWYIERFLETVAPDIRGRVLEIGDREYTTRFGSAVEQSDVLHATGESGDTTIVGDLVTGDGIPDESFDCIVLTQTLPFVFDVHAAVRTLHRALRPGGSVVATLPGISQISRFDMDRWGDFWRFTDASARRLFEQAFAPGSVEIETHGNVAAACAFLQGLAAEELPAASLGARDEDYQLLITVRATR
jgi:SAM-dependent methyltransferase